MLTDLSGAAAEERQRLMRLSGSLIFISASSAKGRGPGLGLKEIWIHDRRDLWAEAGSRVCEAWRNRTECAGHNFQLEQWISKPQPRLFI